jgi:hypothetical protein
MFKRIADKQKKGKLMQNKDIYVGLDVHKNENQVALAFSGSNGQVFEYGRITNDLHSIDRLISRLRKKHPGHKFHFVYEAGPCGFVIYRYLRNKRKDISCIVVAPSKIPKRSGDKAKRTAGMQSCSPNFIVLASWRPSMFPTLKMNPYATSAEQEQQPLPYRQKHAFLLPKSLKISVK